MHSIPPPNRMVMLTALLAASCATVAPDQPALRPPGALMQDCQAPPWQAGTNGALASTALALREALRLCNNDKAALREWAEKVN
jgi:hypothetical protein